MSIANLHFSRICATVSSSLVPRRFFDDQRANGDANRQSRRAHLGTGKGFGINYFKFFPWDKLGYFYQTIVAAKSAVKRQGELFEFKLFGVIK